MSTNNVRGCPGGAYFGSDVFQGDKTPDEICEAFRQYRDVAQRLYENSRNEMKDVCHRLSNLSQSSRSKNLHILTSQLQEIWKQYDRSCTFYKTACYDARSTTVILNCLMAVQILTNSMLKMCCIKDYQSFWPKPSTGGWNGPQCGPILVAPADLERMFNKTNVALAILTEGKSCWDKELALPRQWDRMNHWNRKKLYKLLKNAQNKDPYKRWNLEELLKIVETPEVAGKLAKCRTNLSERSKRFIKRDTTIPEALDEEAQIETMEGVLRERVRIVAYMSQFADDARTIRMRLDNPPPKN